VKAYEMRRKEAEEVKALVAEKKRLQNDPLTHCEGDTDVEDIYDCAVETKECVREDHVKKIVKKHGPALRSHSKVEKKVVPDWAPFDDEVELGFLKEEDDDGFEPLMSTHFYSCRHLLGLQVQRFVEQQQVSLKWITQGLSNSGRLEVKGIPLKQPCNYDTESLLCPQHTQYACQTYRCTSSEKR
jgi:hypothetical protein